MNSQQLAKFNLPDKPGVYFFKKGQEILYIGKATSLRDRVRSYFANDLISTRGSRIIDMVTLADKIDFEICDSVLEALILESALIKKHTPKYNIKEKDDRSYNFVVITKENFPRVLIIRGKELKNNLGLAQDLKIAKKFGPFPNGTQLKEALKLVKKLFPYFDTKSPIEISDVKAAKNHNLNFQINIYPDIYSGKVSHEEYLQNIKNIELLFGGKKKTILQNLEKQMATYAKKLEFEKATKIKKTIFALEHIRDVSLIKEVEEDFENSEKSSVGNMKNLDVDKNFFKNSRIESYDIAHLAGSNTVGVMTVMEEGELKKTDYRKFNVKTAIKSDDYGALTEVLTRRLNHSEWPLPEILVVDGGVGQLNVAIKVLKKYLPAETFSKIKIVSVVKDDKHKAREILEAKTFSKKRSDASLPKSTNLSKSLQKKIFLLNQDTHRFAIKFHRDKRKVLK
jgi:excinuclease ABC subunit C